MCEYMFLNTLIHCKFLTISICRFGIFAEAIFAKTLAEKNVRIKLQKKKNVRHKLSGSKTALHN